MDKLGARGKRVAEREFRGQLEQEAEGKVREKFKQNGLKNVRSAVDWMNRRTIAKPVGEK